MSDGRIIIDTKIDETGLDKGIKGVDKKLKAVSKAGKTASKDFAALATGAGAAAAAFIKTGKAVQKLTEMYRVQIQAETQLEQAAKNNPLLNKEAVSSLKEYASEIQSFTIYGDEELLGFMAQLAAAGRSQQEIMEIMSTATDIAASGTMDLGTAVRGLSASYSGNSGMLARYMPQLKGLTQEQLKNGEAVRIAGEAYKGMAEEVANAVGSTQQMKNAMGDFQEAVGQITNPTTELWDKLWKTIFEKGTQIMNGFYNAVEMFGARINLKETMKTALSYYGEDAVAGYKYFSDEMIKLYVDLLSSKRKLTSDEQTMLYLLKDEARYRDRIAKQREKEEKDAAAAAQKEAEAAAKRNEARDFYKQVIADRDKAIEKSRAMAVAEGREVDQQEIINAHMDAYVQLITESNGMFTASGKTATEMLAVIKDLEYEYGNIVANQENSEKLTERQKQLESERVEEVKKLREELKGALDAIQEEKPVSEQLQDQLDALDEVYNATVDMEAMTFEMEKEYAEKRKHLAKQVADAKVAEQRQEAVALLEIANQFATQYNSIMSAIQQLATEYIENDAKVKTAAVEEQYAAGELSAEQYEERLAEINKKAAQDKYKADMWAWSANLASGIANTALGATKALAEGGAISGPLLAALIVAAGGVQLASIIASKPIPPSFATGGIVPGTSYTGDRVPALVNSGEMILNAGQQRHLFDRINSGNLGGGTKVQVYNQAANMVSAEPMITKDGVRLMIRKTVAKDMADGRFNRSYRTMQNGLRGTRLTN